MHTSFGRQKGIDIEQAKENYRSLWYQFNLTTNPERRNALGQAMDFYQTCISDRVDQTWIDFRDSLPGYNEFWGNFLKEALEEVEKACE